MAGWDTVKAVIEALAQLGVAGLGAWALLHGHSSVGAVLASVALQQQILVPLREVHRIIDEGHQAAVQAGELLLLRDTLPLPRYVNPSGPAGRRGSAVAVEFTSVTLRAPSGPTILDGLDLAVAQGEKIAITGPSGSGKSTILRIAGGLILPTSGVVRIDGRELTQAADGDLVAEVAYVSQHPYVRPGSLRDNLLLGIDDPGDDAILCALRTVGISAEIQARGGLLTTTVEQLGDGTWNWSGGQLQRLALARAMLRQPLLLLLDEPTSGLDGDNAELVWRIVREWSGTVMAVTHGTTERWADRVLAVGTGRIVPVTQAAA